MPLPKFGALPRGQAADQIPDRQSHGQQAREVAALGAATPTGTESLALGRCRDGGRECGLADPRFAVDHDHPAMTTASRVEDLLSLSQLRIPADDQLGRGHRRWLRPSAWCGQPRFLAEQVDLQLAKLRAGVDAELVVQHLAGPRDGGERVGLPIGAVERQGQ